LGRNKLTNKRKGDMYNYVLINNLPTKIKYHIDSIKDDWYFNEDHTPHQHDLEAEKELDFEPHRRR
tara:strand:- start:66 stop:263 length:198 start_codon:yes stop_codon:yes gene_type:complete